MVDGLHGVPGAIALLHVVVVCKHADALAPILLHLQVELHVQEQVLSPNLATPNNVQVIKSFQCADFYYSFGILVLSQTIEFHAVD